MKIETYCPLFPGFYNTMFEPCEENEIYSHNQENSTDLSYDDFEWDYSDYQDRVASAFVSSFEREFKDIMPGIDIKFQKVVSPREYNFRNDSINIEVNMNFNNFMVIVNENKENIREYIRQNYTSRDGFISWHSNDVEDWCNPEYIKENLEHRIGALMEALAQHYIEVGDIDYWADSEMYINYTVKETENE
jgi:hypothetical protein